MTCALESAPGLQDDVARRRIPLIKRDCEESPCGDSPGSYSSFSCSPSQEPLPRRNGTAASRPSAARRRRPRAAHRLPRAARRNRLAARPPCRAAARRRRMARLRAPPPRRRPSSRMKKCRHRDQRARDFRYVRLSSLTRVPIGDSNSVIARHTACALDRA